MNGFYLRIKCNATQQESEIARLKGLLDMSNAERTQCCTTISKKDREIEDLTLHCKIQQYVVARFLDSFTDIFL